MTGPNGSFDKRLPCTLKLVRNTTVTARMQGIWKDMCVTSNVHQPFKMGRGKSFETWMVLGLKKGIVCLQWHRGHSEEHIDLYLRLTGIAPKSSA